jgi:hypothetical protein
MFHGRQGARGKGAGALHTDTFRGAKELRLEQAYLAKGGSNFVPVPAGYC